MLEANKRLLGQINGSRTKAKLLARKVFSPKNVIMSLKIYFLEVRIGKLYLLNERDLCLIATRRVTAVYLSLYLQDESHPLTF